MPANSELDRDWAAIKPVDGSKQDSFEELCVQLMRSSLPPDTPFTRKGRPDSGVEGFATFADGSEWALQAKYVLKASDDLWRSLDESVTHALRGHPRLARFVVCVPLDLPDGRVGSATTARRRWDERVTKWQGLAAAAGMTVDFVWQGSHELRTELTKSQHEGLLHFFFGERSLDDAWFQARWRDAQEAAKPRYTPELNIELPLEAHFEALGRTPRFFASVRTQAKPVRSRLRGTPFALPAAATLALQQPLAAAHLACKQVLEAFKAIPVEPLAADPLAFVCQALDEALKRVEDLLNRYRNHRLDVAKERAGAESAEMEDDSSQLQDENSSYQLRELRSELRNALEYVENFRGIAAGSLTVLTGKAGSGKTHLLCDLARQRLDAGRPTVVLMGQQMTSLDAPWSQALNLLDLRTWSAQEFVSALEVVARRANCRALVIVDAVNEGGGRHLWGPHFPTFIERLRASAWICSVVSVRDGYEDDCLQEESLGDATMLSHPGFKDVEFHAMHSFFQHYGIDLPSTPLLAPEFTNPLYLKLLCRGLQANGQTRLPRGFHGVMGAFEQFLRGVNAQAARDLDYRPGRDLVHAALRDLAGVMVDRKQPWVEYDEAERLVNAHLPQRTYSKSLLPKLVSEGVLIEEKTWTLDGPDEITVVQIAYERLSDYICAGILLDRHFDPAKPQAAFARGAPLGLEALRKAWFRAGIHEALHVLVAERTKLELVTLMPELRAEYFTADAFLLSLVWRDPAYVTPDAVAYLRFLIPTHTEEVVQTLVTLATIPEHPLNADFTHSLLRASTMGERDAWWTKSLYFLWDTDSAVDRLVLWTDRIWPCTPIEREAARLSATILAWLLPSSDRFLRDRATKSLVRVLSWRPPIIEGLLQAFHAIDDAYVAERVLAAIYGAAMRTQDGDGLAALADQVHALVFATGRPRPHILLRDYAHGIILRARSLQLVPDETRWPGTSPPYASDWPTIPSEAELEAIAPRSPRESGHQISAAQRRLRSSIMDDDFARYVIGTNSGSTKWLSLRLGEPIWKAFDLREAEAVATLSDEEENTWNLYCEARRKASLHRFLARLPRSYDGKDSQQPATEDPKGVERQALLREFEAQFLRDLGPRRAAMFVPLMAQLNGDDQGKRAPMFDLKIMQRYILGRVFALGWTADRFNAFDSQMRDRNRSSGKAERIGKKYQWIAYHEILAYMADRYQFQVGQFQEEVGSVLQGSWQADIRDIDPSNVMRALSEDATEPVDTQRFWILACMEDWGRDLTAKSWARRQDDVPYPAQVLFSHDEPSKSNWVGLFADLKWQMPVLPGREDEGETRDLWLHADGALVKRGDVGKLTSKAMARRLSGRGMSDGSLRHIFVGEVGWAPASVHFDDPYYSHLGWGGEINGDPVPVVAATQGYLREGGVLDGSVKESINLRLPTAALLGLLQARWSGVSATYIDANNAVVAFDPSPNVHGPSTLLIRREALQEVLRQHDLVVCWMVQGEKRDFSELAGYTINARRSFFGMFVWDGHEMSGEFSFHRVE